MTEIQRQAITFALLGAISGAISATDQAFTTDDPAQSSADLMQSSGTRRQAIPLNLVERHERAFVSLRTRE